MNIQLRLKSIVVLAVLVSMGVGVTTAYADHSWGTYHWGHTTTPLSLQLGDNVSSAWDSYLGVASSDWSASSVLDTTVVAGKTSGRTCRATNGRVEVCNSKYGKNGWLGIASIWVSGDHITKGTVKLNDSYFVTATYNTPAWKQFVMCQEIGHTFGLDHQNEIFTNTNVGSCMDYTNDPSGVKYAQSDNTHPNAHDYEQLEIIYGHSDSSTTAATIVSSPAADIDTSNASEWGRAIRTARDGRTSLHERDLGRGQKVFTFVTWAE